MAVVLCISLFWLVILTHAQEVPIPPRTLGYVYAYGKSTNLTAVNIDAFYDPLCPDSKQAFPVLQQVAHHYGPDVLTLRLHMFPLPYHRNSYLASMVTFIIISS
jgi:protein-disulfide isomerase